ncbi:hypothetical protein SGRIM128S_02643 [Streptomyces griseomycini]
MHRDRAGGRTRRSSLAWTRRRPPGKPAERAAYLEVAAELAWERGDREDALRLFREVVRIDPDQGVVLAGQGRALAALGRTAEALSAYRAALARQPRPEYALELGELYESLGAGRPPGRSTTCCATGSGWPRRTGATRTWSWAGSRRTTGTRGRRCGGCGRSGSGSRRRRWRTRWAGRCTGAGRSEEALPYAVRATEGTRGGGVRSALYVFHRGLDPSGRRSGTGRPAAPAGGAADQPVLLAAAGGAGEGGAGPPGGTVRPGGARVLLRRPGAGPGGSRGPACRGRYRLPRLACSRSIASNRALKSPLPSRSSRAAR